MNVPRFESFTCASCYKVFQVSEVKEYYFTSSYGGRCFCSECFERGLKMSPNLFYSERFQCVPGGSWRSK